LSVRDQNRKEIQMRANKFLVVAALGLVAAFLFTGMTLWSQQAVADEEGKAVKATPELIEKGKKVYAQFCVVCHGPKGDGKGMMGAALNPKPADFTDAEWKHGGSDQEIYNTVTKGVPGTAMAPFASQLGEENAWGVVHYIKTFSKK
jgi:mono/diheme cytochrome c family protein